MNKNGYARSMMSKSMDGDHFLKYVATIIERQLKEWNETYQVLVLKLAEYQIWVNGEGESYELRLTVDELNQLQNQSPYSLDRHIWVILQEQGLQIERGYGDYLDYVLQ